MAVYQDPRLMDQKNKTDVLDGAVDASQDPQQQAPQGPAPAQGAPADQGQQQAPKASQTPARSGMFTNIRSYVEKNQPASQKMAEAIGGKVQRSADIARKNIENLQGQFTNIKEQKSLQDRGTAVQEVVSAAQAAAQRGQDQGATTTEEQDSLSKVDLSSSCLF